MNPDTVVLFLQRGFHVSLGAASFLVETVQNPQKRDENLAKLGGDLKVLSEELEVEGAKREEEARSLVDSLIAQTRSPGQQAPSGFSSGSEPRDSGATVSSSVYQGLAELTTQLANLRSEIEVLNNSSSQDSE